MYSIEELRFRDPDTLYDIYDPDLADIRRRPFDGYLAAGDIAIDRADDGTVRSVRVGRDAMEMIARSFVYLRDRGAAPDWRVSAVGGSWRVTRYSTGQTWNVTGDGFTYDVAEIPWRWKRVDYPAMPFVPVLEEWAAARSMRDRRISPYDLEPDGTRRTRRRPRDPISSLWEVEECWMASHRQPGFSRATQPAKEESAYARG